MKALPYYFFLCLLIVGKGVFSQTPIIHLPMNGNANDISGNGLHGTVNGATLTTDRLGNANSAYEFNGTNASISLAYNSIYNIPSNGQFTISAWVQPYDANSISAIFVKSEYNANFYLSLWNYGLYLLNNKVMSGFANTNFLVSSIVLSANSCWHHIAVSYNNGNWVLYVDGKIEAQDYSQTKFITQSSTAPINIGKKGAANGDYYHGKIDDVRMYNSALSYNQIKEQMAFAGSDVSKCLGSPPLQLNGIGIGNPTWSPATGLSDPNILNPTVNPNSNTQYILSLTNGTCITRDTINVEVQNCCYNCNILPATLGSGLVACYPFSGNANDFSGNNNNGTVHNAALTTDRFNKPNSAYYFNGTSARIQIPNSTSLNNPIISVTAWVQYGNSSTTQIVTKRNWSTAQSEQFAFDTKDFYVKRNGGCTPNVGWNAVHYNGPPAIGVWTFVCVTYDGRYSKFYKNGILNATADFNTFQGMDICPNGDVLIGATWSTFPFYFLGKIDEIRIYNRAISQSEITQLYSLSATELLPTVNAGLDINSCSSDSFQLNGSGNGTMSWTPSLPLSNSNILAPRGKVPLGSTNFVLTNNFGSCVVRDTVKVNVLSTTAVLGSDQIACMDDSVSLMANQDSGTFVWGPTTGMSMSNTLTPKVKVSGPMQIVFTRTLGACVARDTVKISTPNLMIDAGPNRNICPGDSITLNGNAFGSYYWSPGISLNDSGIMAPKAAPLSDTKYYLYASLNGCNSVDSVLIGVVDLTVDAGPDRQGCKSQSLVINGYGNGSNFSWSPIKYIVNNLSPTPIVNPDSTTTYVLTTWNSACVLRDTMTVFVNTLDAKILSKNVEFCLGDTVQINGWTNAPNYTWLPAAQILNGNTLNPEVITYAGNRYYLTVSDASCTRTDSIDFIEKVMQVSAGIDTVLCMGEAVQLNALSEPGASYRWLPITGLSSSIIQNPIASPISNTMYIVEARLGNCLVTDTLIVAVDTKPLVNAGLDKRYCFGESSTLNGMVSNATGFVWSPPTDLSDIKELNPTAFGAVPREYILSANNGKCIVYDTVWALPNPEVIAKFSSNVTTAILPALIQFTNQSSNAHFYAWDFGFMGNTSVQKDPSFNYTQEGRYTVWLIAKDSLGCLDSTYAEINMIDNPYLYVPNVFTPTGDLLHDSFQIKYNESAFAELTCSIYNRWGELIFETKFPNGKWWDGTYKNVPCAEGVYFYVVYAKSLFGEDYNLHGTVTLLR